MAITVDPITVPPLKITSVSPSLVTVFLGDLVPVLYNEAELENLAKSSDAHLDEIKNMVIYVW